jgi:UDPglucose--hexose-1-phosphate uridylyltransferase
VEPEQSTPKPVDDRAFLERPHRRFNALTGSWVLVSPHRARRPWQGQVETPPRDQRPAYDPACYLCPGNARAGNARNPSYQSTFVFDNDFSALLPDAPEGEHSVDRLLVAHSEKGICRVICFSPRHDLTLAEMGRDQIQRVVEVWTDEYGRLGSVPFINHVQIFENKGPMMGCSNPHPHGQIWAQNSLPDEPAREADRQEAYFRETGRSLLADYLAAELRIGERMVAHNDAFAALVPYWAVWPFEVLIISRRHFGGLLEMQEQERADFADIIRAVTVRYDNLFNISFPYSAGIHQSPTDQRPHPEWHFHMHFYPPLLRSATVRKFMVGYEMLADPQRDITPELSAERLRNLPEKHYKSS